MKKVKTVLLAIGIVSLLIFAYNLFIYLFVLDYLTLDNGKLLPVQGGEITRRKVLNSTLIFLVIGLVLLMGYFMLRNKGKSNNKPQD